MMSAKNGRVSRQILKVVHYDSHKQIEQNKSAQKLKADEIKVRKVVSARFCRHSRVIGQQARFTIFPGITVDHYLLPRFTSCASAG